MKKHKAGKEPAKKMAEAIRQQQPPPMGDQLDPTNPPQPGDPMTQLFANRQ